MDHHDQAAENAEDAEDAACKWAREAGFLEGGVARH
jgi:hypothetical protein